MGNMVILLINEKSGGLDLGTIAPILDIPVSVCFILRLTADDLPRLA